MTVRVLHLSDIHVGPDEVADIDSKVLLPGAAADSILERLSKYLRSIPRVDYVAITGDISIRGARQGMDKFSEWLQKEIDANILPPSHRIIIVPGNHDVAWPPYSTDPEYEARYKDFFDAFGKAVPHAHIPFYDPPLDANEPRIGPGVAPLWGGLTTETRFGNVLVTASHPFILDLERQVLLFAFNSTLACGVHLHALETVLGPVSTIAERKALVKLAEQLKAAYLGSLRVDAGMIGPAQLRYFDALMGRLRGEFGSQFDRLTKIALLHHHVSHLWNQQLELKEFDSVIDAARLKQSLVENGFSFVLHGHKHTNHVGLDASVIPLNEHSALSALCIISGGTVGGQPRLSDRQSFKLLTISHGARGQRVAVVDEIPLLPGNAAIAIQTETRRIRVPNLNPIATLRDFPALKLKVDDFVARACAPEIFTESTTLQPSGFLAPFIDRELVHSDFRYEFLAVSEPAADAVYFYDVMLATAKLGFQQRARILWMLTSVKAFAQRRAANSKAILMIGNLEQTSYNTSLLDGEITASIAKLRAWFKPAIDNNYLDVRTCLVTQGNLEALRFDALL